MKYLIVFILILSCNPQKRIARQDEKAINYVSAKKPLLDRLTPIVLAIHPCVTEVVRTDSITTYITDTITQRINVPYSVYKNKVLDTIINDISIFADSTTIMLKYLGSVKIQTNTIFKTIKDESELNRYKDTLIVFKVKEGQYIGQIKQLQDDVMVSDKEKDTWLRNFWVLLVSMISIQMLLLYFKLKKGKI